MTGSIHQTSFFDSPIDGAEPSVDLHAPFVYFGAKRRVADLIWYAFGDVAQYIEPFCGSAAVLLASPKPASLEVVGDLSCYIANVWRAIKHQPDVVATEADYPVSHIDLSARHRWLTDPARIASLAEHLKDAEWPGDPKMAGYWIWGMNAWIGSGWCDGQPSGSKTNGKIPNTDTHGKGLLRPGLDNGQIPVVAGTGSGILRPNVGIQDWMRRLADRLKRVRLIHGTWDRCMNVSYGDDGRSAGVFFDPPYKAYEHLYRDAKPVAGDVEEWCREHPEVRIALCGHVADYDLPGWQTVPWSRGRKTYGGGETTDKECIWFSPACRRVTTRFTVINPALKGGAL